MSNLQITKQGLEAAASLVDQGFKIKLTRFRLGDGTGYVPDPDGLETDLHGSVVHTAPISGYTIGPNGQLNLVLRLSATVGTFTFGEIAIDAEITPGNFLTFATAVLPTPILKESSLSSGTPSTFTAICHIRMNQGNTVIQVIPGDVNAGGVDYQVQINNLQQQINNMSTPENFQPQIDAINLQLNFISNALSLKPSLATYSELNSATPPTDKAVAANHLRNKAADNLIQLTPGGLYLPQASIIGLSGGLPTYTGPTVFSNADNSVACSGLVSALELEVGDVVKVEQSSLGNNKLFTVTSITDNNNIKFNETHSFQKVGIKSLKTETANIKFTRVCKWYNAPVGLGQGWNYISCYGGNIDGYFQGLKVYPQAMTVANRSPAPTVGFIYGNPNLTRQNNSNRTLLTKLMFSGTTTLVKYGVSQVFASYQSTVEVDNMIIYYGGPLSGEFNVEVPPGSTLKIDSNATLYRELS